MKTNKNLSIRLFIALGFLAISNIAVAEFGTLFTTASERKTIDDNRYIIKRNIKKQTTVAKIKDEKVEELIYQTIEKEYAVSGLSIANNGADSAWINGKSYENGESLNEKVLISINPSKRMVRFTVRGGKTFYGKSGDTVIVSYRVPILE